MTKTLISEQTTFIKLHQNKKEIARSEEVIGVDKVNNYNNAPHNPQPTIVKILLVEDNPGDGYKKPRQNGQAVFRGYWLASWGVDMTACPFCPGSPSGPSGAGDAG